MNKLSIQDTIDRWQTYDGRNKQEQIIDCLINNKPFEKLPFIEQIDDYFDLRGLSFDNKTKLKKVEIRNIDFSYSNFYCMILDECRVENVIYGMCDCTEMLQYSCNFNKCKFIKSKFLNAGFGIDGGQYNNIIFEDSNLKGAMFFYPNFNNCTFKNCRLDGVDFSASHFNNVKFVGKLNDVWFRGESPNPEMQKMLREKGRGLNPMVVDFADADLWFVTYSDSCDLSKVVIPNDGQHYLLNNFKRTVQYLEIEAEKTADKNQQKFIKEFIEMYKYHIAKQDMVIINTKNLVSNAEYYLGKESEDFCKDFIKKLIMLSYTWLNN